MRVVLSWSTGKDSAWTLYELQQQASIEIVGLLTTVNTEFNRVAMHAVREELLDAQAEAAGLSLFKVPLPWPCTNTDYEKAMFTAFDMLKNEYDITHIAYGDLFLEDIRQYRLNLMEQSELDPLFPIWQFPTKQLAVDMIDSGLSAYIACVDPKHLHKKFAGLQFNHEFISSLDASIDPCGENGEFHTFANAGPMFKHNISVSIGEAIERDGFIYNDILLAK